MAMLSPSEMVVWLGQNQFLTPAQIDAVRATLTRYPEPHAIAKELVQLDWLTPYQVNQILQGNQDQLVLGDYRLRERIGDGAMGQVFKAWSLRLQRVVAIKTIHKDRVNSPKAAERFHREVQAVAQLAHPNIALVRDAGDEDGRLYLVMDFINGFNLSARVKQYGPMPVVVAAEYVRQAALGLQHAFERGVVHRDIKPANLMVTAGKGTGDGKPLVKILDFGLARYVSEEDNATRLTQLGNLLGTVDYVAPEQAQNARDADIRADIYSLGCTLYYLLAGQPPFLGESMVEKIGPRLTGEPPWLRKVRPDIPPGIEEIVRKMMARLPVDRYQTPTEVAEALTPYATVVAMATPVQATALGPDAHVPMALPVAPAAAITIASAEAAPALTGVSASGCAMESRKPQIAAPKAGWPVKWIVILGGGFLFAAVLCLGGCLFVMFPIKPRKECSIIITEAKLSTPSKTVRPGDTKFVLVYIERVNFDGPVTITLEDLPPGVVGKEKTVPPGVRSADVSFTVSFGTEPITTKIRVVAECQAEAARGELWLPFSIVEKLKK